MIASLEWTMGYGFVGFSDGVWSWIVENGLRTCHNLHHPKTFQSTRNAYPSVTAEIDRRYLVQHQSSVSAASFAD